MKKLSFVMPAIIIIAACNKPKTQCVNKPVDKSILTGTWMEYDYGSPNTSAFARTMYKFQFYGDSFRMETWNITDAISFGNCSQNPHYEYAKGSWALEDMRFRIKGFYTNETYNTKTDTCFKSGAFEYICYLGTCNDTLEFGMPQKGLENPKKLHR